MKAKKFLVSLLAGTMAISALSVSAFAKEQVEVSPEAAAMGIVAYKLSPEETVAKMQNDSQTLYTLNNSRAVNTMSFSRTSLPTYSTSNCYNFNNGSFRGTATLGGLDIKLLANIL